MFSGICYNMFADDLASCLGQYFENFILEISIEKPKLMVIHKPQPKSCENINVNVNGHIVERVYLFKYFRNFG